MYRLGGVVWVGVGGILKSHKEREECRKSWNDCAADTKTGADAPVSVTLLRLGYVRSAGCFRRFRIELRTKVFLLQGLHETPHHHQDDYGEGKGAWRWLHIAQRIADCLEMPVAQLAVLSCENAQAFFNFPAARPSL